MTTSVQIGRGPRENVVSTLFGLLKAAVFARPLVRQARLTAEDWRRLSREPVIDVPVPEPRSIVDLYLPDDVFLRRTIRAPWRARRDLGRIADLDLRQNTPFGPDEAHAALGKVARSGDALTAEQWVLRAEGMSRVRTALARQGVAVRRVLVDGRGDLPAVVRFETNSGAARRLWGGANVVLLLVGVLSLGAALAAPGVAAQRQAMTLLERQETLRAEALSARAALEADRDAARRRAQLDEALSGGGLARSLVTLTESLPDEVWIEEVVWDAQAIRLIGTSSSSSASLVLDLARNDAFAEPRLDGAVMRMHEGTERFEMIMDLRGARETLTGEQP